jgi:predicted metal-dependent hydrolase
MASITVMKNYVIKKAQGTSDENLKKIVKVLKNYNKLDAESKGKVGSAVEKLYTKFKAQESKQSEPKKAGTTPPKSSGKKKKFDTQNLKGVIAEFRDKVGAKAFKQATANSKSITQDAERPALPKGKRLVTKKGTTSNQFGTFKNKVGRPYWENRSNRFDIKQPAKKYPILAKGGEIAMFKGKPFSFYKYETKQVRIAWKGKIQPFGAFYSVIDAIEELKKHYETPEELREFSIVTPDGIIYYGKEYPIKFSEGGEVEFIEYKDHEIMYEPHMDKYYANDVEFDTLDQAKKFLDSGKMPSHLAGAYARGLFAKGGELGTIGKFKYEITMVNQIEGPFVVAKFIAKGDALICLDALQKATSTKGMRYTLKESK